MTNLIRGYIPFRITLPSISGESEDDTFMFVKQHFSTAESSRTLFVTNTPIYPFARTNILLRAIFERYGDIEKILVAPRPNKNLESKDCYSIEDLTVSMFKKEVGSVGNVSFDMTMKEDEWYDQGRFAHIIFSTAKEMKKFMKSCISKQKKACGIKFGRLEIQELQDISRALYVKEKKRLQENYTSSDDKYDSTSRGKGQNDSNLIHTLASIHNDTIPSRALLKEACERIMIKYEGQEEDAKNKQKENVDEEGFITVSYSASVGDAAGFEENGNTGNGRREKSRSRKSKVVKGSDQLQDFYRFQLRETKKRHAEELKNRFQEDLKKVKRMKEDKKYRPFR